VTGHSRDTPGQTPNATNTATSLHHILYQGILIVATELLAENPNPSEAEVREAISGNLCRCTGYDSIVAGILHEVQTSADREIAR
jgi:hypothetical protein